MIRIVPYDPAWPGMFAAESACLQQALGDLALRIEHVGSTSVPGLDAKPVIDIQVSVRSLEPREPLQAALVRAGYMQILQGDFDRVYPFFQKPEDWPCTHHVHLCELGGEQEHMHLAFRDYLRTHPQAAVEYVKLKRELAASHHGKTHKSREGYSLEKTAFVADVLERVRADRRNPSP